MKFMIISDKGYLVTSELFDTEQEAIDHSIDLYLMYKERYQIRVKFKVVTTDEWDDQTMNTIDFLNDLSNYSNESTNE